MNIYVIISMQGFYSLSPGDLENDEKLQKHQENKGEMRFESAKNRPSPSKTRGKQRVSGCRGADFGSISGAPRRQGEIF